MLNVTLQPIVYQEAHNKLIPHNTSVFVVSILWVRKVFVEKVL